MEDKTLIASGESSEKSSGNSQDMVAYDSYQKAVAERKADQARAKKAMEEAAELRERLKEIELDKQQAEGNKDDVIVTLRKELGEVKENLANKDRGYARSIIEGQLSAKATELGCDDLGLFMAGLNQSDGLLAGVEVDDNFQVNTEDLTRVVEKMKDKHPRLFKEKNVVVHDIKNVNLNTGASNKPASKEDIINKIKLLDKQGR